MSSLKAVPSGWGVSIAIAFFTGCTSLPQPQETQGHDLRGPVRAMGSVVRSEMSFQFPEGNILITVGDQTVQGRMEMRGQQVLENEVLRAAGPQMGKVKVRYAEDTLDIARIFCGKKSSELEKGPLHGRTVVGDQSAGAWRFHLAEGKPSRDQTIALEELAGGFGADIYPARPVRVGESWPVDPASVKRWLGHDLLRSTGKAQMTLREITTHAGERCARLELEIDVAGTLKDALGNELEISMGLQGTLYRSLETHTDLSGQMSGLMILEGTVTDDGTPVGVKITGPITVEGRDRLQPAARAAQARP